MSGDIKPIRMRSKWLWLAGVRAEVELVRPAHRSPCASCGAKPEGRRLHLTIGSGRSGHSHVLCSTCATVWVSLVTAEGSRAVRVLHGHDGPIRYGSGLKTNLDQTAIRFHQLLRPKKKDDEDQG